jgi:hypothetical protein
LSDPLTRLGRSLVGLVAASVSRSPRRRLIAGLVFAPLSGAFLFVITLVTSGLQLTPALIAGAFGVGFMLLAAVLTPGLVWMSNVYHENERRYRESQVAAAARTARAGIGSVDVGSVDVKPPALTSADAARVLAPAAPAPNHYSSPQPVSPPAEPSVLRDLLRAAGWSAKVPPLRRTLAFTIGGPTVMALSFAFTSGRERVGDTLIFGLVGVAVLTGAALLSRLIQRKWIQPLLGDDETDAR